MDKENRRNSILKPAMNHTNQTALFEYEEKQTETFTSSRNKSFKKRVSFAGKDEIKEFQKHEAVTIQKLEKVLILLHNETQFSNIDATSSWNLEKENMDQHAMVIKEISIEQDYMDVASTASAEWNMMKSMAREGELRDSKSECDHFDITSEESTSCNKDKSTMQEVEMDVCAYSLVQIPSIIATEEYAKEKVTLSEMKPIIVEDDLCYDNNPIDISIQHVDMQVVQEYPNVCRTSENGKTSHSTEDNENKVETIEDTKTNCSSWVLKPKISETGIRNGELIGPSTCILERFNVAEEAPKEIKSFYSDDTYEYLVLAKQFNWEVSYFESTLVLSKIHNYLCLKLKLNNEYMENNVKHYIVEDIEIDTRKDVEQKWTRLGLIILENSLENINLREVCGNTQNLPKLLNLVETHVRMFIDFATEDSVKFENFANPRSLKFNADYCNFNLVFESSNLENLFWVRITLNLIPRFPLLAKVITIESILGKVNKAEITNMISNIRPNSLYLTRIAECVEDFLKFRSVDNERKMLNYVKYECV